jgi:hypothetical protein
MPSRSKTTSQAPVGEQAQEAPIEAAHVARVAEPAIEVAKASAF